MLQLILGLALMILGYLLMPKTPTKQEKPQDLEAPTSEAGRAIPVLFGDMTLKAPNYLGWWDKQYKQLTDDSGSKK